MRVARLLLAAFFVVAGLNHFISPRAYVAIVPPFLPWPRTLVWVSGVAEIAGGAGVLIGPVRRRAGYGLIALLVTVFPANVYAAIHGMSVGEWRVPEWMLWTRLPLQGLLIWWVYRTCISDRAALR